MAIQTPFCYVVMPFGVKPDELGGRIDFDEIYTRLLNPAIKTAGLQAIRADEELLLGDILEVSLRSMIAAGIAIFDLSTANPNVLYELGIRHALRPRTTILVARLGTRLPFDLNRLRVVHYSLNAAGHPDDTERFQRQLTQIVRSSMQTNGADSPVYRAISDLEAPQLPASATGPRSRLTIDVESIRRRIEDARWTSSEDLDDIQSELGDLATAPVDLLLTLLYAYRSQTAWTQMVELIGRMPVETASSTKVQEQLAFALNRIGDTMRAEQILLNLLETNGPSSETFGLLGRVYKDQWEQAPADSGTDGRAALLKKAIDAYIHGFETDWRDPYPGINALTLMEMLDEPDSRRDEILPVVTYAAKRKLAGTRADYWDMATLLELQVLAGDEGASKTVLSQIRSIPHEAWQTQSTWRNLQLICQQRERRGEDVGWVRAVAEALL